MKNLVLTLCFSIFLSLIWIDHAKAVDALDPCKLIAEEIVPLRVPNFDQAAIWKKTSGVKGRDRPRALLPVVDGGQIVIGASTPYDDQKNILSPVNSIQIVRTDRVGKMIVEKWIEKKDLRTIADAILLKDRIVALAQMGSEGDESIGLSFLNGVGEERAFAAITDPKLRLIPKSIMSVVGGTQMVIAAEAISRDNVKDSYSVLIWVDKDGKVITQKEYLPGVKNKPEYVGRLQNGEIVMTGRTTTEDGRDAGWVLRLSSKGEIRYQRPYARGGDSVIRRAVGLSDGSIIVVGDALPSLEGDKAAWVMRIDNDGNPIWQKYLTGKYGYSGVDVIALNDGRLNVLISGKPTSAGGRQYARVVTLSQNGVVIGDESFIEGSNAIPMRLINQNGYRILMGLAETGFSKPNLPDELKYVAYDTWLLGLSPLIQYHDTCQGSPTRTLDDLP